MTKRHKNFLVKLNLFIFISFLSISLFAEKSTITFKADSVSASVSKNKKITKLIGNAVIKLDDLEMKADSIEISGKDYRFVNATGAVHGEDKKQGYTFKADFIKFDRKTDIVIMSGQIELNDKKNDVTITAENVEYKKKAEIMIMRYDVKILKKEIECNSMFALYNRKESQLELTGKPSVKKSGDKFQAGKITVNLETEDIALDGRVSGTVQEERKSKPASEEKKPDNKPAESDKTKKENEKNE